MLFTSRYLHTSHNQIHSFHILYVLFVIINGPRPWYIYIYVCLYQNIQIIKMRWSLTHYTCMFIFSSFSFFIFYFAGARLRPSVGVSYGDFLFSHKDLLGGMRSSGSIIICILFFVCCFLLYFSFFRFNSLCCSVLFARW